MKKLFEMTVLTGILFIMALTYLTPDKTMNGNYTDMYRYWLDDDYYQINFVNDTHIPLEK